MRFTFGSRIALLSLLGIAACAPPPPSPDASNDATPNNDSAIARDSSANDAAPPDAATTPDANPLPDASEVPDSGALPIDSGVPEMDSGVLPMDSGVLPMDSGVLPMDSGVLPMDSGVIVDTGVRLDTGVIVDTGVRIDSGVIVDTGVIIDSGIRPDSGIAPGTVFLTNATADFSQPSYPVSEAVNGIAPTGSDGWAITNGGVARTAVFETMSDTSAYSGGTDLTFTFTQTAGLSRPFTLGRFRISVTTADRAMFADGLANGGNLGPAMIWSVAQVVSASANGGQTMTTQSDYSVLVSGANPDDAVYTVRVRTPLTRITGVRLEALTHASLPAQGPGRAPDGNFVLSELGVIESAAPIPATAPVSFGAIPAAVAASFSQASFDATEAIDGMITIGGVNNGWAISDPGGTTVPQTAVFETASDTPAYGGVGTRLVFTLHQQFASQHTLGRFRLLATTANRSMFANGVNNGGDLGAGAIWTPLTVRSATAMSGTATFAVQPDGSILASGVSGSAVYQIAVTTPLEGITGVRLEALADPSLPGNGPGNSAGGNFVLTEMQLASGPQI